MGYADPVMAKDVKDAATFIKWAETNVGIPYVTINDKKILGKKAKDLFKHHPGTDWQTIVQVAQWCVSRKRRCGRVWQYVDQYRWAYASGAISISPVLSDEEQDLEAEIMTVVDPVWRARLLRAVGTKAKRAVLDEFQALQPS